MKRYLLQGISLVLLIVIGSYFYFNQIPQFDYEETPFLVGGIQINEPDYDDWTNTLEQVGMNTVSVTVYCKQSEWNSGNIDYVRSLNDEEGLLKEIRIAKAKGLKVVLIPRVAVDHAFDTNKFIWHGMIFPKTTADVEKWFKRYQAFVQYWAKISEKEGIDVFAVGSELRALSRTLKVKKIPPLEKFHLNKTAQRIYISNHLKYKDQIKSEHLWVRGFGNYQNLEDFLEDEVSKNEAWAQQVTFSGERKRVKKINERRQLLQQKWENLIDSIRTVYNGKLTYAANFDNYHNVGFWDKLDFIGINAYFQLRQPQKNATQQEKLETAHQSWKSIFKEIERFKWKQGLGNKKVIFTELGYINKENCMVAPWEGFGFSIIYKGLNTELFLWKDEKEDAEERTLAVEGLLKAHKDYDNQLLTGILYWKLTTKDYHLPHEPFALHIKTVDPDPLQNALIKFNKKE